MDCEQNFYWLIGILKMMCADEWSYLNTVYPTFLFNSICFLLWYNISARIDIIKKNILTYNKYKTIIIDL